MPRRQSPKLPRLWLMTDERMGDRLIASVAALPRGSGIIVRHYGCALRERHALFDRIRKIARKRRITLLLAGSARMARAWKADGYHGPGYHAGCTVRTMAVHSTRERILAERSGVDLIFVSPVFATASHTRGRTLGRTGFGLLTRKARIPVIALGGMTAKRARSLRQFGAYGWAAIDSLTV